MVATKTNKPSKNILMLHGGADLYGGSKIFLQTVKVLMENGYDIYVVLDGEGPLISEFEKLDVEIIVSELGILRRQYFNPLGLINRIKALYKARKFLLNLVSNHNIDLIYSNTTSVLVGCYVANKTKLPHVWHIHEIIRNPKFFTKFISWHLNQFSDEIIVVSEEVRKHWNQYVKNDKITTIYNGLNYSDYLNSIPGLREELGISNDQVIIGMIGRVNLWKGQSYFLKIASEIYKTHKNVAFVMVGDAYPGYEYLYDNIKKYIKTNNLQEVVYDLGYRKDIPYLLASFDLFVLPSIQPDPLPTVVLEAMASSKPVIATAHGGALEMVLENETGMHIPWDDAFKAVDKFKRLIDDQEHRELMGNKGRERVLNYFSESEYEKNIISLIKSTLK